MYLIPPIELDSCKIKTFSTQKCRSMFKNIFNTYENVRIFSVYIKKLRLRNYKSLEKNNLFKYLINTLV